MGWTARAGKAEVASVATKAAPAKKVKVAAKKAKPGKVAKPLTPWQKWSAKPVEAIAQLCTHVTEGGHAADFCRAHGINYPTLLHWINADPVRVELYARAREERADVLADEIVAISDEVEVKARYDGEEVSLALDAAAVARNRLRVDARKWVAAKLKPRTYGEKLDVTAEVGLKNLSDEQVKAQAIALAAKLGIVLPGTDGAAG